MDLFLNMVRGFCMALADSVPGVSGGTIAFVLGFYDEFIGSLYVLTHGNRELKREGRHFPVETGTGLGHRHGFFGAGDLQSFHQPDL